MISLWPTTMFIELKTLVSLSRERSFHSGFTMLEESYRKCLPSKHTSNITAERNSPSFPITSHRIEIIGTFPTQVLPPQFNGNALKRSCDKPWPRKTQLTIKTAAAAAEWWSLLLLGISESDLAKPTMSKFCWKGLLKVLHPFSYLVEQETTAYWRSCWH